MSRASHWERYPQTEQFIAQTIEQYCQKSPFLASLQEKLRQLSSTELIVWVDHLAITEAPSPDLGYEEDKGHYTHPGGLFPNLVLEAHKAIFLKVDSIEHFHLVHGCCAEIEGSPFGSYRRSCVAKGEVNVYVVERRGARDVYTSSFETAQEVLLYLKARELWSSRPRDLENEEEAMQEALKRAAQIREWVGQKASSLVMEVERAYWQYKNRAAQIQKARQDSVGMGWANHDHHTFRSSRIFFHRLVQLFESLGFSCRERFYAGKEAGWGAQVMEDACGYVLFLDVDLEPHELAVDFAHQELVAVPHLNTVGLWCALHGDSILHSGMHHLECQFSFEALRADLAAQGVGMMEPFSHFSYLKQAFTAGEHWKVDEKRIALLLKKGLIKAEEAEHFRAKGAVGSHLENLERHEGYKGFNQKNVSFIIQQTDPRTYG